MITILPGVAANGLSQNGQQATPKATASQAPGFAKALEQIREHANDPAANLPPGLLKILAESLPSSNAHGLTANDPQVVEDLADNTDREQIAESGANSAGFWLLNNPFAMVSVQEVSRATGRADPGNGLNHAFQLAGLQHQIADLLQKPQAVAVPSMPTDQQLERGMPTWHSASAPQLSGDSKAETAMSDASALMQTRAAPAVQGTATPVTHLPENQAGRGFTAQAQHTQPNTEIKADSLFTGAAHTIASAQPADTGNNQPGPLQITSVFGSPQWRGEFEQQIMNIAMRGEKQVALHLNPRELGPLIIDLKVVDNQAQIHFLSSHANVRNAVEQALPQLRELLDGQGISLGDTSVSAQSENRHQNSGQQDSGRPANRHLDEDQLVQGNPAKVISVPSVVDSRVDLYI